MRKAAKVFLLYYIILGAFSLTFSILQIDGVYYNIAGVKTKLPYILIPTIIGGIITLYYTLSPKSLRIFLVVYTVLWMLRFVLLYISSKIGMVVLFGREYRFDVILVSYYKTISRLDTHLPFVLYWIINYLFTEAVKQEEEEFEEEDNSNPTTQVTSDSP